MANMEVDIPQSSPLSTDQTRNNAGGYGYKVTDMNRLRRFLVLGCEGGTYYTSEKDLQSENAACIEKLIASSKGQDVVKEIVNYSVEGRTAKQNPIIFALAMCARSNDTATKQAAYKHLAEVCRIPTHLFHFIADCEKLSSGTGWGRAHRRAIANWYLRFEEDPQKLSMHVTKYKNRNGWCHRDVLRLAHPKTKNGPINCLFKYIIKGIEEAKKVECEEESQKEKMAKVLAFLDVVEEAKKLDPGEETKAAELIQNSGLVREHLPTNLLNSSQVWKALLEKMPMTAVIRNLGKMSSIGILEEGSDEVLSVAKRLTDRELLRAARIHPFNVLVARATYAKGAGDKGKLKWQPNNDILHALEIAFKESFKMVVPTNKRHLLALDVSGSMGWGGIIGSKSVTPMEGSAALAMVTLNTEAHCDIMGFSDRLVKLNITKGMDLETVQREISVIPMGGTDCAIPMIYARENNKKYDVFVVYTDNETWFGNIHPSEALRKYRQASGIWDAKLIVVAMTSGGFSIADPEDPGMLDMVGFDSDGPAVMADFVTGKL